MSQLRAGFDELGAAPLDNGQLVVIVRRLADGARELPERARLTVESGLEGDVWSSRPPRNPNAQLTVMRRDIAELIANGQALTLFGDNLFIDLDISHDNLPPGTRLRVADSVVEVTPEPHTGCRKFRDRFGQDALRFTASRDIRVHNPRGIHWRVIQSGTVRRGDTIEVLSRG